MAEVELLKTALYDKHVATGAVMGPDGGWAMPLSFRGAVDEARQVHSRAGVFDLSNIGRIRIRGPEAPDLMERVCTADVVHQEDDTARCTLLCNPQGGILDQCLAMRLDDYWLLATSPGNRPKVLEHLLSAAGDLDVKIDDQTIRTATVCIAGPTAEEILDRVLPVRVTGLAQGQIKTGSLMVARYLAARTSYMGVWALEVTLPNMFAGQAWRFITDKAGGDAIPPAGQAARDVLRIEAGRCRYGHELDETIDPFTAGLGGAVDFGHEFLGAEALDKLRGKTPARKRVSLVLTEPDAGAGGAGAPPLGAVVSARGGRRVGAVTSSAFSPKLQRPIAMAYVSADAAEQGRELLVALDGAAQAPAVVAKSF